MPDFGSDAANALFADIAAVPPPEAPRVAAARRAMQRVGSREGRDLVASQLIRALPVDEDPTAQAQAILAVCAELDAADTTPTAEDELGRQVAAALQPEPAASTDDHQPYVDDAGKLRSSDRRIRGASEAVRQASCPIWVT